MRHTSLPLSVIIVLAIAASAAGQTITVFDMNGPRVGGSVSYGGHGADWAMSLDSRTFWKDVQFRAIVGQGRWVGLHPVSGTLPPPGSDPTVTRVAVTVIKNGPFDAYAPVRVYGGYGVGVLIPRGTDLHSSLGFLGLAGIEAVGDRWSFGPEVQLEGPANNPYRPQVYDSEAHLKPTLRIGFSVRRRI